MSRPKRVSVGSISICEKYEKEPAMVNNAAMTEPTPPRRLCCFLRARNCSHVIFLASSAPVILAEVELKRADLNALAMFAVVLLMAVLDLAFKPRPKLMPRPERMHLCANMLIVKCSGGCNKRKSQERNNGPVHEQHGAALHSSAQHNSSQLSD